MAKIVKVKAHTRKAPKNTKVQHANTGKWAVSNTVRRQLDANDVKSLQKSNKFYVEQIYHSADKVQDIGIWLAYNKYRKDDPKWKSSYKTQTIKLSNLRKDAIRYKKLVADALLKPPNHTKIMTDINHHLKLIK